ncbi:hypothetical protein QQM39_08855 [Streptomyces sp. DT2A-34]|uniref:DUF6985 domain-containing protein n=1 Tax=Streptomyces sp. DT2A-34 TaxID=3051182 RepID=UPI00265BC7F6|nr:hypothetical protein [Streptomyces sp. DT2A-34]MDO0910960.1 hypothetical protein [Streptomyces sp. DT2A-34]
MTKRAEFFWDDFAWTTRVPLPPGTWAADGAPVPVHYAPEGREDHPLDDVEIASVARAVENLPALLTALRPALRAHYEALRPEVEEALTEETIQEKPDPEALVGLSTLYVHPVARDGIPYVGVEFDCSWDEEHGLGVLMHGTRVVDLGGADTALLLWIAEQDAENPRTGLDEALIGHWSSTPFDYGVMECSEFELRANGRGWSSLANAFEEYVTELTWRCPEPGVLELRPEGGEVARHRYALAPAVPLHSAEPVTSVTFQEPVAFCHQFAKSG